MKKNLIMLTLLASLFFIGLLIYDFSDEIDKDITNKVWYGINNNQITILKLDNNKISYIYDENEEFVEGFENCSSLHYNHNHNKTKFNCAGKSNNMSFAYYDDSILNLTLNKGFLTFYASKKEAEVACVFKASNITDNQYQDLLSIKLDDYKYLKFSEINKYYNSKKDYFVAFLNSDVNLDNILNLEAFNKLLTNNNLDIQVLDINNISIKNIESLRNLSNLFNEDIFNKKGINIYKIGNEKVELSKTIDIKNIAELDSINWE